MTRSIKQRRKCNYCLHLHAFLLLKWPTGSTTRLPEFDGTVETSASPCRIRLT